MGRHVLRKTMAIALGVLGVSGSAFAKDKALTRTENLIQAFITVKALPEDGSPLPAAHRASNATAFQRIDGFFDYDTMGDEIIAPHRKQFTAAQAEHFKDTFKKILRLVSYPNSGAFLASAERTMKKETHRGKRAEVPVYLEVTEEDIEMDVVFIWQGGAQWKLIDVSFDGAKLSRDYQNQFGRIIAKEGVAGLIKKLDKRLAKALKNTVL